MASAGCRYEVDLYIFFFEGEILLAVLLLHPEKIPALWRSVITKSRKRVTDQADWKYRCVQMQFYIYFYFFLEILIMTQ